MKTSAHVLLGERSGKNLDGDVHLLRKNFIMVNELKYGQSLKIWPSPLSLSLCKTFNRKRVVIPKKNVGLWLRFVYLGDNGICKSS